MNKGRSSYKWMGFAAASFLAVALAGCGSSGGGGDIVAVTPPPATGGSTPPAATVPTGTSPITLTSATPAATFAALAPVVNVGGVSVSSPPVVTFSVADANNNPIIGLGSTSKSSTATVASYPNLSFALAKLVPGKDGAPSKWVSYIVTTVPTTTAAATAGRPSTDSNGTLVDNKNGTYSYTFYRDITKVKDQVAALTLTGANNAADLGDLTFEPNLVHRLTIAISGNAPGTGTNTPNGVQTTTGVPLKLPVNVIYDFIPATGKPISATDYNRDIVNVANCNTCHDKLGGLPGANDEAAAQFHGGNRNETRYCVVCHTDQRKYGRAEDAFAADGRTYTFATGGGTYRTENIAMGNFPRQIHKIHLGTELYKKNYNYAGVLFNEVTYPQDHRNCDKCHTPPGKPNSTKDGDSWQKTPNRLACGACHDGISFVTGKGVARGSDYPGHIGGPQADDSKCALCHDATSINAVYHLPVTPPNMASALHVAGGSANTNAAWIASNPERKPAGAITVTYDIKSVSRNASKQPVMVFRMLQNGARKDLNVFASATANPATGAKEIWDNFMGAPSVYFVFAVPQDGIAAPSDFNATISVYLRSLWNGAATGGSASTLTGPDADGYYTATVTGSTVPDNAVMLTGGLGYSYNAISTLPLTQTNLADYPVSAATATTGLNAAFPNKIGGLIVIAPNKQLVAAGYTGRRAIVEDKRCNNCHQELGAFTAEAFHAGQRNDGTTCAWCHRPNQTSGGWSADSTYYVHAIHGAKKRTKDFMWHANTLPEPFSKITYPGILKDCTQCHIDGGYDFSNPASTSNRLYRTVGQGTYASTADAATKSTYSPYVAQDIAYGTGFSFSAATGVTTAAASTTLVMSPIATVCFACHDSDVAKQHMESNGASFYKDRTTALPKLEQCMFCHSSTSQFGLGVTAVHKVTK